MKCLHHNITRVFPVLTETSAQNILSFVKIVQIAFWNLFKQQIFGSIICENMFAWKFRFAVGLTIRWNKLSTRLMWRVPLRLFDEDLINLVHFTGTIFARVSNNRLYIIAIYLTAQLFGRSRFLATGGNEIFQRYNELVIATSDISYDTRAEIYSYSKRSIIFRYNVTAVSVRAQLCMSSEHGSTRYRRKDFERYGKFLVTLIVAVTFSCLLRETCCAVCRIISLFLIIRYLRNPLFDTVYC